MNDNTSITDAYGGRSPLAIYKETAADCEELCIQYDCEYFTFWEVCAFFLSPFVNLPKYLIDQMYGRIGKSAASDVGKLVQGVTKNHPP